MKNLKKLFLALMLFTVSIGYSQIETTISAPNTASVNDSILAINASKKAKHIPFSELRARVLADIERIALDTLAFNGGGDLTWNSDEYTLNLNTTLGPVLQIGQELYTLIYNDTGVQIDNLMPLRHVSATLVGSLVVPTVELARSDIFSGAEGIIMVATMDIPNGSIGLATVFGRTRDGDTSMWSPGDALFLAPTTGLTNVQPEFPNYDISIGGVLVSDAVNGEIFISITRDIFDTFKNFYNGTFRESFVFNITSNGTVITGSIEPSNGHPDMTMIFSDGFTTLDTSPAATITLTAGTDTNPQMNYIYILESTKVLTTSTSSFPTAEHIKVANTLVQSALEVQSKGSLRNHNYNDHIESTITFQGHLSHITERMRIDDAKWDSGVAGTATINTSPTPDDVFVSVTGGKIYQIHKQSFPVLDIQTGDDIHVVNHSTTPFLDVTNLNTQILDAIGGSLNNTSFSFVMWGVINSRDEPSHLMLNLPTGSYAFNAPQNAVDDALNRAVYTIPKSFEGVGFLISRFTFTYKNDDWVLFDTEDLRGKTPNTTAGGGAGGAGVTEFLTLTDTPSSYTGQGGQVASVGVGETALEFRTLDATDISDFDTEVSNNAWSLLGNATTVDGTNFIGTTDNIPLTFRVNNIQAGRIDQIDFNTFFGYNAGVGWVNGQKNVGIGEDALKVASSTFDEVAIGYRALYNDTGGNFNTAIGNTAGNNLITGLRNTFLGYSAGFQNVSGDNNIYVGYNSGQSMTGDNNIIIGHQASAESEDFTGDNHINIGNRFYFDGVDFRFKNGYSGVGTTTTNGTTTLTGSGTAFSTSFDVGDVINLSGETTRIISTITSDTNLTVTIAFSTSSSGHTYSVARATKLKIEADGELKAIAYGQGIITGTPTYALQVDADGNVIEGSLTGGGDVTAGANLGDNLLVRGDGAGKGVQNSGISINDTDDISGIKDISLTGTVDGIDIATDVAANTAKVTNVSTNLSEGTTTNTTVDVNSSDGTNATLVAASTSRAGVMTKAKFDEVVVNNAKTSNATHTSEVTGATALTIASGVVDTDNLVTALKGESTLAGTEINFTAYAQLNKVLTANTTFTIINPRVVRTITLKLTGNFTITLPSTMEGDLSAYDGTKTNTLYINCIDEITPVYNYTLHVSN